jgi:hypothetical protein
MQEISLILEVALLFFLRIGFPVLALIALGVVIDRWQTRREAAIRQRYEIVDSTDTV